jgi:hypothetical protein
MSVIELTDLYAHTQNATRLAMAAWLPAVVRQSEPVQECSVMCKKRRSIEEKKRELARIRPKRDESG